MKTFRALGAITLALEACVGLAGFCAAQDSRQLAASADEGGGLEEITVYAQKRGLGESNQKVPIAITAVSANTLEEIHSVDVRDLGKLAPNVQTADVGSTPAFPNFTIRGIGVNSSVRSIDPAVNIVVDGMTVGYQTGAIPSTFDLESIEILRGPQGVLFGRNSTGGAIVLRTRRPSADLEVTGRARGALPLPRLWRGSARLWRGCRRNLGIRAVTVQSDPPRSPEAQLHCMSADCSSPGPEPANCPRARRSWPLGSRAGVEIRRSLAAQSSKPDICARWNRS
jgi:hypothetical protein